MGRVIWITGLSGAGKTTIARELKLLLQAQGETVVHVDGDNVRTIMGDDLGYGKEDRLKNAYRISRLCAYLEREGVTVVCSTISLFSEIFSYNRSIIQNFTEVFVQCDMTELHRRDQKNLYSACTNGDCSDVIGVDQCFDYPSSCHLVIDNSAFGSVTEKAGQIMACIYQQRGNL